MQQDRPSRSYCCCGKGNKYNIFWVCACSLCYPACKAHVPFYIALCVLSVCTAFPHYLINGSTFGKPFWTSNVSFDSLYKFCLKYSHLKIRQHVITNVQSLPVKCPLCCLSFNQNWNFSTDFRKIRKYQISRKTFQWGPVVPWGKTDRATDSRQTKWS
jgi:hypothetical protein